ncbi:hypothetical protein CLIB1444_12S02234 [[Candida] jaroonii]|uniref:Uncharacterized protein n=1 Tax=[Candida] jaroonii TaxID=467808 RepID=A0ACA9YDT6_9ASCO|nr:hypothetical protein CLIB1444_12S02234 [[Candida] jaroonii]
MSEITDPSTYNKRDLLLVLQLLHTEGLIDPSAINAKPSILKDISYNWFNHKSTKLSMMNGLDIGKQWTIGQLVELYNNLLAEYPNCSNTTDLANTIYAERVEELERKLEDSQQQFEDLINE